MHAKEYEEERSMNRKEARKAICNMEDELDRDGVEQLHYRFVGTRRADMTAHEMFAELCRELDIDD